MPENLYPRGSEWRRWDPHLHAPGTLLADGFKGDWQTYLERLESALPSVEALGVTDYFCIETYKQVRKKKNEGRLPGIKLIFPNVEMRFDIKTEKARAINIHLLFSPEDPNHEIEISRALADLRFEFRDREYHCTLEDFAALGREFDPKQTDETGAIRTDRKSVV